MMLFLLERFIEVHPQERISEDIRHGFLSAFLLKPFPYLLDRAVTTLGGKLISFLVSTPALLLVFYLFREYFVIKTNSPLIFLVILSILLSYALQLLLGLLIGLVAFWIQKVRNLFSFYYIAFSLLGGGTVPLALFPKTLQTLASILPFRYVYSLPLEIYFERLSLHAILFGVLIQVLWILITLVTLRFVWKRGLRYYSAVGG
jgi:ABC-2 type transport system permease protein